MKFLVTLTLCCLSLGSSAFAAPTIWTVCRQGGIDDGLEAIFTPDAKHAGKLNVSVSSQSVAGPQQLAVLPCQIVSQKKTPSADMYTNWNCQDGNDAGFRVTLTSGGFAGLIHTSIFKNVSLVAQLPCAIQSAR